MKIKVVIGANLGDEGKGLVSGCLAKNIKQNENLLTVLFNGGAQRAHTLNYNGQDIILHNVGAGNYFRGQTYYHPRFLVDPIALWLTGESVIIDPNCRVVLPCDIVKNRKDKKNLKHGSCGMGIFACAKRSQTKNNILIKDILKNDFLLYNKIKLFSDTDDELYNLDNFMLAINYLKHFCQFKTFDEIKFCFDNIIFEGGQGLMLDQFNKGEFPNLTPSNTGCKNIAQMIESIGIVPEIYYVSRTYLTRHGNGKLDGECNKNKINPAIVDKTNLTNPFQGSLRFGKIDLKKFEKRIKNDLKNFKNPVQSNIVFTHMNYTDGKLFTLNGFQEIEKLTFINNIYSSFDKKDFNFYL